MKEEIEVVWLLNRSGGTGFHGVHEVRVPTGISVGSGLLDPTKFIMNEITVTLEPGILLHVLNSIHSINKFFPMRERKSVVRIVKNSNLKSP